MSKQITISDVKITSMSFGLRADGKIGMTVGFERLDEAGDPIEDFNGTADTVITGDIRAKLVEFVQGHLLPWIRTQEGING